MRALMCQKFLMLKNEKTFLGLPKVTCLQLQK